jgi:hypothetical protein
LLDDDLLDLLLNRHASSRPNLKLLRWETY